MVGLIFHITLYLSNVPHLTLTFILHLNDVIEILKSRYDYITRC